MNVLCTYMCVLQAVEKEMAFKVENILLFISIELINIYSNNK